MEKLRIGIAGAKRGRSLYKEFQKLQDAEVVAVMDPDRNSLDRFLEEFSVKSAFDDYEKLLDFGLDIVVIASPMQFHAQQAIEALNRNIHVLSEVTAAITVNECKELLLAAQESKAQYMLAENYCYMRENIAIKNMVKAGLFGKIYYGEGEYIHRLQPAYFEKEGVPTWRKTYLASKRGCTYGTHSLGPLIEWTGEAVTSVNCLGTGAHQEGRRYTNDDTTLMLCKTSGGALFKIRTDIVSNRPHNMAYYSLQGTKGCYEGPKTSADVHKVWLEDYSKGPEDWLDLSEFFNDFLPPELVDVPEEARSSHHQGADYYMVKDFVKSIREGKPVSIDIKKALLFTLPGIISEKSIELGGDHAEVPDINNWLVQK
ncbi:Gfo/Idh/MocA family oxidoreductase [Bacillus sp. P14.5]|uniref:Gfo/Idh/MocA family protein n=1 Tax=Bacillus sp. P14.5 TaxID=1983400 RepID=UPI000DEBF4CC|nr:Gfo/Idh/MocA family oxidoreductase [Bacillus sp. P14.5]